MEAKLTNYHQAPRKVRAVSNLVKGRSVKEAIEILNFFPKKAALPLKKLIQSAAANAVKNTGASRDSLRIGSLSVNKGMMFKRYQTVARGGMHPIRHRTSTIRVTLTTKPKP